MQVVSDRLDYHSEDLIFPVGFCSTRVYGSLKDPEKKCVYTCKILDGGTAPTYVANDLHYFFFYKSIMLVMLFECFITVYAIMGDKLSFNCLCLTLSHCCPNTTGHNILYSVAYVSSFEIVADSDLDAPIVGNSAKECHSMLLRHINHAIGVEVVNTQGRGPEFFGFSHPTIQNLIQSSPGTRKCSSYKWSKFEVRT